jgi:hypothetical protein
MDIKVTATHHINHIQSTAAPNSSDISVPTAQATICECNPIWSGVCAVMFTRLHLNAPSGAF